jgi:branched-chain amino acid aminotransferase
MFSLRLRPLRFFSKQIKAEYSTFFHKDIKVTKTTTLKPKPAYENLLFGKNFTDHMLEVDWTKEKGWEQPQIVPYHNLSLPPSCTVFHYAIECFEGMKAYSNADGSKHFLFRPEKNARRLNNSCARLALPTMDEKEFTKCVAELINLEKSWIPVKKGYSLYVRPTVISTDPTLGVAPPQMAKLFVILSPVGPYFRTGFKPVKLLAEPKYVRAFPGGTGQYKVGANYGPTILPQLEASQKGYSQVLWLIGQDHVISEVGTMNIFFHWINKQGQEELITAPLDGTVLPGVTRDSVIEIAKQWGLKVTEDHFTMDDVIQAKKENRIFEAFGAGTACVVAPVSAINFEGKEYDIPVPTADKGLAPRLFDHILSIQHGEIKSPFCVDIQDVLNNKI